jgi:hypothetical protein
MAQIGSVANDYRARQRLQTRAHKWGRRAFVAFFRSEDVGLFDRTCGLQIAFATFVNCSGKAAAGKRHEPPGRESRFQEVAENLGDATLHVK